MLHLIRGRGLGRSQKVGHNKPVLKLCEKVSSVSPRHRFKVNVGSFGPLGNGIYLTVDGQVPCSASLGGMVEKVKDQCRFVCYNRQIYRDMVRDQLVFGSVRSSLEPNELLASKKMEM